MPTGAHGGEVPAWGLLAVLPACSGCSEHGLWAQDLPREGGAQVPVCTGTHSGRCRAPGCRRSAPPAAPCPSCAASPPAASADAPGGGGAGPTAQSSHLARSCTEPSHNDLEGKGYYRTPFRDGKLRHREAKWPPKGPSGWRWDATPPHAWHQPLLHSVVQATPLGDPCAHQASGRHSAAAGVLWAPAAGGVPSLILHTGNGGRTPLGRLQSPTHHLASRGQNSGQSEAVRRHSGDWKRQGGAQQWVSKGGDGGDLVPGSVTSGVLRLPERSQAGLGTGPAGRTATATRAAAPAPARRDCRSSQDTRQRKIKEL